MSTADERFLRGQACDSQEHLKHRDLDLRLCAQAQPSISDRSGQTGSRTLKVEMNLTGNRSGQTGNTEVARLGAEVEPDVLMNFEFMICYTLKL